MIQRFIDAWIKGEISLLKTMLSTQCALRTPHQTVLLNQTDVITYLSKNLISNEKIEPYLSYHVMYADINKEPCIIKIRQEEDKIKSLYITHYSQQLRRVRLDLAYDGTHYKGSQRQQNGQTIQSVLESTLTHLLKEPIQVHPASRTDAGVHAKHQVVHFDTASSLSVKKILEVMNQFLPKDMLIKDAIDVPFVFHSRYDAISKTYQYLLNHEPNPFKAYQTMLHPPINIIKLNQLLQPFVGTHNFEAFAKKSNKENTIRTITKVIAFQQDDMTLIEITGDGFLRHMVRMIVGCTLYDLTRETTLCHDLLKKPNVQGSRHLAPPQALYLKQIRYE